MAHRSSARLANKKRTRASSETLTSSTTGASPFASAAHPHGSLPHAVDGVFTLAKEIIEKEETTPPITRVMEEAKKASPIDQVGRDALYGWRLGFFFMFIMCFAWWLLVDFKK